MTFTDVEMSILSQLAYKDIEVDGKAKNLYDEITKYEEWLDAELGDSYSGYIDGLIDKVKNQDYTIVASEYNALSGFSAYAVRTPDNEVVVACRGTQLGKDNTAVETVQDIITDIGLGVSPTTAQHTDVQDFVDELEKQGYDGYYFTGHSLGGNVASHGAATVDDPSKVKSVTTFNSPGFNEAYWMIYGVKLLEIESRITNYQNEYDYVSSILEVPGKTRILESSLTDKHWWVDDHFINAYAIDDGNFVLNLSQNKHPQTNLGYALGEFGQNLAFGGTITVYSVVNWIRNRSKTKLLYRDFSDAAKQNMLNLVTQVESEKWGDFTDWIGDRWYDFEAWIGTLDIRHYINNVNSYHKKVIDKNNASEKTINEIFAAVRSVDAAYGATFDNLRTNLFQWKRYIDQLAEIMDPGAGRFTGTFISNALNGLLKEITSTQVQCAKDMMIQMVDGEPLFDEEMILSYIKKDPAEMSDAEKQALLEVLDQLQDNVAFYQSAATVGNDQLGADFWNRAYWVTESEQYASFSAVSAHYNDTYVNILNGILEQDENSNTFAASLLKICNGEDALTVLGLDCSEDVSKIFGSSSLAAYVAQWKTEHSEEYFAKLEISEKNSGELLNDIKEVGDIKKTANQWLEDQGLRTDEKVTKFYDENGNEITEKEAGFYDRDYTIAEIDATASVNVSLYDGKFDVGENGKVNIVVGNAEAHAGISAGLYVIGANGEQQFMPGVNAEIGASVTAFEADWEQQWLGNENLGLNTEAGVTAGQVGGKGEVNAQLFSEDGKLDVQVNAEAKLEAIAVEAEGSVGVNVLGGEIEASAGVNVGVGAHAEVGYKDGKFKFDVGASLGVGVSVDVEVDVGGMVDTVVDKAQVAWDGIKYGWNALWN